MARGSASPAEVVGEPLFICIDPVPCFVLFCGVVSFMRIEPDDIGIPLVQVESRQLTEDDGSSACTKCVASTPAEPRSMTPEIAIANGRSQNGDLAAVRS